MEKDSELLKRNLIKIMCQLDYFLLNHSESADFNEKAKKVAMHIISTLLDDYGLDVSVEASFPPDYKAYFGSFE